jgi:hypothetical protein
MKPSGIVVLAAAMVPAQRSEFNDDDAAATLWNWSGWINDV